MKKFYKIPNVIFAYNLSPSAFVTYIYLSNSFYFTADIKIKLETLSKRLSMSINTVRKAVNELHNKGLITVTRRFKNGYITTNQYTIKHLEGKFSRIDCKLFYYILCSMGKSALMVFCAIIRYTNHCGRAFPSYKQLSLLTGLSRITCIAKVSLLGERGILARAHYICAEGDFGNNNYAAISLRLRVFLFKLIADSYNAAKSAARRLYLLLKSGKCKPKASNFNIGGGKNFDKHIIDPPKYDIKIESNSNLIFTKISIIHRSVKKFFGKLRSSFAHRRGENRKIKEKSRLLR